MKFQDLWRNCEDGEIIFREGDFSREMFVISQGEVEILKNAVEGPISLAKFQRGDFFGEMSLLESLPRSATAVARGKTRVLCIQPGGFLLKIRRDPTFAFEMMQSLSSRIRNTNEKILRLIEEDKTDDLKKLIEESTA